MAQMTIPFIRDLWENLISPFWKLLVQDMLLRKFENMPWRSSSPNQLPIAIKLIISANYVTKLPMKNQKEIIKCKPCNGSHPRGKCLAYGKLCLTCNRKNHFKVCCPQNGKKVHKIGQTESNCEENSNLEFFV